MTTVAAYESSQEALPLTLGIILSALDLCGGTGEATVTFSGVS